MSAKDPQPPARSPFYPVDIDRLITHNEAALAFFDLYPVSKGHALVIPRDVVPCLFNLPEQTQCSIWLLASRVRTILKERFNPDGFNIGINDGQAAGQTVLHAHVHILPRYKGDVADPRGGMRWIIPEKVDYWSQMKQENH